MSTKTETPDPRLALLQQAVAAKAAYWDALAALERDCTAGEGFSDAHNDSVIEFIDNLAAGIDTPSSAFDAVDIDSLQSLNVVLGQT